MVQWNITLNEGNSYWRYTHFPLNHEYGEEWVNIASLGTFHTSPPAQGKRGSELEHIQNQLARRWYLDGIDNALQSWKTRGSRVNTLSAWKHIYVYIENI